MTQLPANFLCALTVLVIVEGNLPVRILAQTSDRLDKRVEEIESSGPVATFLNCDGTTDLHDVVAALDRIIEHGASKREAELIAAHLKFQSVLYENRDKFESHRLRSYLFVVLSKTHVPDSAISPILEALASSQSPIERASAARAASSLGERGRVLIHALATSAFDRRFEVPVVLHQYSQLVASDELWTTERIESIAAMGKIKTRSNECERSLAILLNSIPNNGTVLEKKLLLTARTTIRTLRDVEPTPQQPPTFSTWRNVASGKVILTGDLTFNNQDGTQFSGTDLLGKPCVVSFFYSACKNARRCDSTIDLMLRLRSLLEQKAMQNQFRICLLTLEPQSDTPEKLRKFGALRGLEFDSHLTMLQPLDGSLRSLKTKLQIPVSNCCGTVSNHGAVMYLFDASGKLVFENRAYETTSPTKILDYLLQL